MIKKILALLNLALITGAIFFSVKIFYTVVSARLSARSLGLAYTVGENRGAGQVSGRQKNITSQKIFKSYQAIIDRDLFKTQKLASTEISTPDIENLEKTTLNLKLWGTITGDPDKSYAVIEDTGKHKQQLYRDGDSVSGAKNAKIKLILRKKIVLSVNGKDEILEMQDMDVKGGRRSRSRSSGRFAGETYPGSGSEIVSIDRKQINESLKNINNLMRQVRVRPYFEEGKPGGILLSGIQRRSIFEKMGLKSGDIVKGVNGTPIRSVDDALKFYENLKSADSVQLQIKRRGEEKTIRYQIH